MAELEATVPGVTESAERLHRCLSKLFSILRRGDPSGSAAGAELTLAQLSIAWCTVNPHGSTVITGASRVSQVLENMTALEVVDALTPDVLEELVTIVYFS